MLELTGLAVGILLGLILPMKVPVSLLTYTGVALLALLATGVRGVRDRARGSFEATAFLCALLTDVAAAVALTWLGEAMGIPLYLAPMVFFGGKMFQNFGEIREELLTSGAKKDKIKQDIEQDGEGGTK